MPHTRAAESAYAIVLSCFDFMGDIISGRFVFRKGVCYTGTEILEKGGPQVRLSKGKRAGLLVSACALGATALTGNGALRWLRLWWPGLPAWLFWPLWLLPMGMFTFTFAVPRGFWKNLFRRVGEAWFSAMLYPLGLMTAARLLGALWPLPLREAGWWVLGLSAGILLIAVPNALLPRVREYTLPMAGLAEPMKAVLFADLHLGYFTPRSLLPRIRDLVNRQEPDMVFIAGDIFDEEYAALRHPEEALEALAGIRSRYGVFACEGNHDNYAPSFSSEDFIRRAGIRMLRDECIRVGPLTVAGRLDYRRAKRKTAKELLAGRDAPSVILDHNPRSWAEDLNAGAALALCGHTHGGQTFPGNLLIRLILSCPVYGLRQRNGGICVVTSGCGVWGLPVRLGVAGEIVVLRLTPTEETGEFKNG